MNDRSIAYTLLGDSAGPRARAPLTDGVKRVPPTVRPEPLARGNVSARLQPLSIAQMLTATPTARMRRKCARACIPLRDSVSLRQVICAPRYLAAAAQRTACKLWPHQETERRRAERVAVKVATRCGRLLQRLVGRRLSIELPVSRSNERVSPLKSSARTAQGKTKRAPLKMSGPPPRHRTSPVSVRREISSSP